MFRNCESCGDYYNSRSLRCPWCDSASDYVRSEPSGNDLGAPQGAPVDPSATEGAEGLQISDIIREVYAPRASAMEAAPEKFSDPVNSPGHYRWLPVEAIEITELFNFNMGNALKYIIRADHKGKPIEDLQKAAYYVARELDRRARETAK